ncbi:MAG: histidinol-phosphatase [bacterium]|jgi:histidinol-phosphatase (PHP family)|nr:histidinol-phosphatase [bacterium]
MLPDLHLHTPRCRHAVGEPDEYAQAAWKAGLRRIVFTDHAPLDDRMDLVHRMACAELEAYHDQIRALAAAWRGRLEIGVGLEVDWLEGFQEINRAVVGARDWDLCLGSVHFIPGAQGWDFIIRCAPERESAVLEAYWQAWGDAAASGLFHAMSHPDVYRMIEREPLPGERELACRALDRAARAGVAVECNTSLLRKGAATLYPAPWLLEEVLARGMPLTSASDAHHPEQAGSGFALLAELARRDARVCFTDFRQGVPRPIPTPRL